MAASLVGRSGRDHDHDQRADLMSFKMWGNVSGRDTGLQQFLDVFFR